MYSGCFINFFNLLFLTCTVAFNHAVGSLNPFDTRRKLTVNKTIQEMSRACSEHFMYVQFTPCTQARGPLEKSID